MFPPLRQCLWMLLALVAGAGCLLAARGSLVSPQGYGGLSLFSAASGASTAVFVMLLASLPAVLGAVLIGSRGNVLGGFFVLALSFVVLASQTGGIEGWVFLHTQGPAIADAPQVLPGRYGALIGELWVWLIPFLLLAWLLKVGRDPLRERVPAWRSVRQLGQGTRLGLPDQADLLAALMCAVIGGVGSYFLMQTANIQQVLWSIGGAFAVGGLVAHLSTPRRNPVAMLVSPLLVGLLGYAWVLSRYPDQRAFLEAWHGDATRRLPPLARALPLHFVAAGVAGVSFGIGWAQALIGPEPATSASNDPAADQPGDGGYDASEGNDLAADDAHGDPVSPSPPPSSSRSASSLPGSSSPSPGDSTR